MNFCIIVQARMGSTRLPGKILKKFYGEDTLIETLLNNLHKVKGAQVVVATSVDANNDILEYFLTQKGELVYRGSENDVLDRFIKAAEMFNADGIIRICSDNPFLDWRGVDTLISKAKSSNAEYIGFRINNTPSIKTHFGFWGEFVTLNALKRVTSTTNSETPAHEHVTIEIYSHPDEYKCEWIECPSYLQGREDIRLTVDTIEDFNNAQHIYSDLKKKNDDFGLVDIIEYLDKHSGFKKSMSRIISDNKK